MKTVTEPHEIVFHTLKFREGGVSEKQVRAVLTRDNGIPLYICHSPYVGHFAVSVPKRLAKKALRVAEKEGLIR